MRKAYQLKYLGITTVLCWRLARFPILIGEIMSWQFSG
jgi:hypothetical protein